MECVAPSRTPEKVIRPPGGGLPASQTVELRPAGSRLGDSCRRGAGEICAGAWCRDLFRLVCSMCLASGDDVKMRRRLATQDTAGAPPKKSQSIHSCPRKQSRALRLLPALFAARETGLHGTCRGSWAQEFQACLARQSCQVVSRLAW